MERFLNYLEANPSQIMWVALSLIFLAVAFSVFRKYHRKRKIKILKRNAEYHPLKYKGMLLKILEIDEKADRILFGLNPTRENPLCEKVEWFVLEPVPSELRLQNFVVKFENGNYVKMEIP